MPLHPVIAGVFANMPAPPPGPLNPAAMRAGDESQVPPLDRRLAVHSVTDQTLPTPARDIPVRIYRPSGAATHPVLVYFHGGAFFLGSLNTHDHIAREVAKATGCMVVSVDYRLAPEHAFPAGLIDCYAVVQWIAQHGATIGWNGTTLAVAGDSSGANFAAAVTGMAQDDGLDGITHQVLFYPSLDLDFDLSRYPSLTENAVGYGLETALLTPFNAFYIGSGADPADPRVSPIKRKNLAGLPPAFIVTAQYDPLRDEGETYARNLIAAGVGATLRRYDGATHGFVQYFSALPEFHGVFADIAVFLKGAP